MIRRVGLWVILPVFLASCTSLDALMPWTKKSVSGTQKLLSDTVEATIRKAKPSDPEHDEDPGAFVLIVRNKRPEPLSVDYKIVFMDPEGDPTDVKYGTLAFEVQYPEQRKGVVPAVESSQARVTLYRSDTSTATASATPSPHPSSTGIGGSIGWRVQSR